LGGQVSESPGTDVRGGPEGEKERTTSPGVRASETFLAGTPTGGERDGEGELEAEMESQDENK